MPAANAALQYITVLVTVREIPLALVFYRDILGLTVIDEQHEHATLAGDDGSPAIVVRATHDRGPTHTHDDPIASLTFANPSFEGIRTRLLQAAIPFRITATAAPEIVVRDLDGNEIIVRESAAPTPEVTPPQPIGEDESVSQDPGGLPQ